MSRCAASWMWPWRKNVGPGSESMTYVEEQRLSLVQQEGQELFDSGRVAVAAGDWSTASLQLEKALMTIGSEARR